MIMNENPYADILLLPHHQSDTRPHMSLNQRAAQFSAFDALTGFDEVIDETGRLTDRRKELSETEAELLDDRLSEIISKLQSGVHPLVTAEYFVPDARKEGGCYRLCTGRVKRVDTARRLLIYERSAVTRREIALALDDIVSFSGPLFE